MTSTGKTVGGVALLAVAALVALATLRFSLASGRKFAARQRARAELRNAPAASHAFLDQHMTKWAYGDWAIKSLIILPLLVGGMYLIVAGTGKEYYREEDDEEKQVSI